LNLLTPFGSSGVAAIWTFWIYPGTTESEGAANVGLKQYIAKTILNFQNILGTKFFAFFFYLCFLNSNCFSSQFCWTHRLKTHNYCTL